MTEREMQLESAITEAWSILTATEYAMRYAAETLSVNGHASTTEEMDVIVGATDIINQTRHALRHVMEHG